MERDGDRIEMDGIVEGDEAPLAGGSQEVFPELDDERNPPEDVPEQVGTPPVADLAVDDETAIPICPVHAVPMVPAQDDLDAYPHGPTDEMGSPVDPIMRCPEQGCTETATTHAAA